MTLEQHIEALYGAAVDAHANAVFRNIEASERAACDGGPFPTPEARGVVLRLRLATALIRECIPGEPVGGHTTGAALSELLAARSSPAVALEFMGRIVGHGVVTDGAAFGGALPTGLQITGFVGSAMNISVPLAGDTRRDMPDAPTLPPKRPAAVPLPSTCRGDPRYQPIGPAYPYADMRIGDGPWPVAVWTSQLAGAAWGVCASGPETEPEVCADWTARCGSAT